MREIVLDTETTGLSYNKGDRIIEIGCLELFDKIPTGNQLHVYINPQKFICEESIRIHGLTEDFLKNKPLFNDISDQLLDFINKDPIVAHNASFDMGFLNNELNLIGLPVFQNTVIDTLKIARKLYPSSPASLNALCRRFKINITHRELHGALKDADLLAKVYYFLSMQNTSLITEENSFLKIENEHLIEFPDRANMYQLDDKYIVIHNQFLSKINPKKVW